MWRRHRGPNPPSHHALRGTCVQLLPLLEMYCKWELQEDCSNLRQLMLRFDSDFALETHVLGRSLLLMVRDDDVGLQNLPPLQFAVSPVNPFDTIMARLAEVDHAFQSLHAQVQLDVDCFLYIAAAMLQLLAPAEAVCMFTAFCLQHTLEFKFIYAHYFSTLSWHCSFCTVSALVFALRIFRCCIQCCWCLHSIALVFGGDFLPRPVMHHSAAWHNSFPGTPPAETVPAPASPHRFVFCLDCTVEPSIVFICQFHFPVGVCVCNCLAICGQSRHVVPSPRIWTLLFGHLARGSRRLCFGDTNRTHA